MTPPRAKDKPAVMLTKDPPARMPQVAQEDLDEAQRAFLGKWTGGIFNNADKNPVLRTFAHHPALADVFSPLNIHLLSTNTLPVKLRQIAIMRTAWLTKATYMWSSHLNTSRSCGLSDAMYAPIQHGPDDPYFTPLERTVMRATEDLVTPAQVERGQLECARRRVGQAATARLPVHRRLLHDGRGRDALDRGRSATTTCSNSPSSTARRRSGGCEADAESVRHPELVTGSIPPRARPCHRRALAPS